jgi:hypothetical protein
MHFQPLTVLATILAVASAAPSAEPISLEARNSVNDCGDSTFENQSSDGSPLIVDCQKIASNIAGTSKPSALPSPISDTTLFHPGFIANMHFVGGGTWSIGNGGDGHRKLVQYGTCAFGVDKSDTTNVGYVGNQDIIDLINESIRRFSYNGKVGSKGSMDCQSAQGVVDSVRFGWGLYHN